MRKIQFTLEFDLNLDDYLKKNHKEVVDYRILSQSLDARNAPRGKKPSYTYQLEVIHKGESFSKKEEIFHKLEPLKNKPIIIGAGPAGIFAALRFAEYGVPVRIFERGDVAGKRMLAIGQFWRHGKLDLDNNVCYGEGGAGLFSDGKLITRIKSHYISYVMDKFVEFGAPPEVAYMANPHLGSNKIRTIITKMSEKLKSIGCEIHYKTRIKKLLTENNIVIGVETTDGKQYFSDHVILATGHSAHEIYHHLNELNVAMKQKSFAVGVRVEHPRNLIDTIQHGQWSEAEALGAARYRLSYHDDDKDVGTYSFCMCPGGYVLSSGTDQDGIVANGMSNYARNSPWSNSALVVSVKAGEHFDSKNLLSGMQFQKNIEQKAYQASKAKASGKEMPAQRVLDFMQGKESLDLPNTSCPSKLFSQNMKDLFPNFITNQLKEALNHFDKMMKGFISKDAVLVAPETRTSAPVSISRGEDLQSTSHRGLYPAGEGAGHAGGITSAAVDGVRIAMSILKKERGIE